MAILTADIDEISVRTEHLPQLANSIAEVVVDWNVNYTYKNARLGGKREYEGNCQDFVNAVLK